MPDRREPRTSSARTSAYLPAIVNPGINAGKRPPADWATVKTRWQLSIDPVEQTAVSNVAQHVPHQPTPPSAGQVRTDRLESLLRLFRSGRP